VLRIGPDLGAVAAHRGQPQRREDQIEIGDRPPADQRTGAFGPFDQARQRVEERFRHMNGMRRRRDIQERAVDVEQESKVVKVERIERHAAFQS